MRLTTLILCHDDIAIFYRLNISSKGSTVMNNELKYQLFKVQLCNTQHETHLFKPSKRVKSFNNSLKVSFLNNFFIPYLICVLNLTSHSNQLQTSLTCLLLIIPMIFNVWRRFSKTNLKCTMEHCLTANLMIHKTKQTILCIIDI